MNQKALFGVALVLGLLAPMAAQAQIFHDMDADQKRPQATRYQPTTEFSAFKGSTMATRNPLMVDAHSVDTRMLLNIRNNTDETQHFQVPEIGFDYALPPRSVKTINLDTATLNPNVQYRFENEQGQQTSAGNLQSLRQHSGS